MTESRPPPIDAHVHVWDLARRRLPWLPDGHPLRRNFSLHDFPQVSDDLILVQADADPTEVTDLLDLAAANHSVLGVVGWIDLLADDIVGNLTTVTRHAEKRSALGKLLGIRSPPSDQTDPDALTAPAFVRGVQAATDAGLAIDLLLRPPALLGAARLAVAVPNARLVLDHLGNPVTADAEWLTGMKALAERPNVTVKLSGTAHLPDDELARLIDVTFDLFGSDRLMFGSDWPVCTLSSSRAEVVRRTTEMLPIAAHNDVFRGTARRTYRPRETAP